MSTNKHVSGRATLSLHKKEIMEKILFVWQNNPNLRLGELLVNAMATQPSDGADILYIEDYDLLQAIEQFSNKINPAIQPKKIISISG